MRKAAESGRPFVTRAARETLWPLVDADDLADLYVRAVEARSYRLTAVGCGIEATSVGTLMDLVRENLGLRLDLAHDEPPPDLAADLDVSAGYAVHRSPVATAPTSAGLVAADHDPSGAGRTHAAACRLSRRERPYLGASATVAPGGTILKMKVSAVSPGPKGPGTLRRTAGRERR